jgi:fused signal recognition particle receptor
MRIYFFTMFRFFKKKPTPSESSVEDQSPTLAPQELELRSDQPPVGVIVPETQTPVTPVPQDEPAASAQEAVTPSQTPFRRSAFGAALGGAGSFGVTRVAATEAAQVSPADPVEAPALESVEILEPVIVENSEEKKASWLARLKGGLAKTGQSIGSLFIGVRVDEALFEELETALIMADAGVEATEQLLRALRLRVKRERIEDAEGVRQALREVLTDHLKVLEKPFDVGRVKPLVVMITGVNGAGKTTSIGKLAYALQRSGARVLLAAGDTFRAAARQQLIEWGDRNNVDVIAQEGADPAAVAFDSVHAGRARGMDVVMVDTAGRLPTQLHLMDELKKIRRVIAKADPTAPHEVLLVVDGNSGQNVLAQIRAFDAAVELTGLIVTKLDGTAKGGTLAAVAAGSQGVRPIPVYWIGVGEKIEDLQPFVAAEFAAAVVG